LERLDLADTLEEIRKHVEELILRLSEVEAQPAPPAAGLFSRSPSQPSQPLGDAALSDLETSVEILATKVDQAGNLLAQVTDLLESQAERLETLELQVGEPEPAWQAAPTPVDAASHLAPSADPATALTELVELLRAEIGALGGELRDRIHTLDARIGEVGGRFQEMRELAWQHRGEIRDIEERLLILSDSHMREAGPGDELEKLALRPAPVPEPTEYGRFGSPPAAPESVVPLASAPEFGAGESPGLSVGAATAAQGVVLDPADAAETETYETMTPMDARTARRLEELVEREVRLQQDFTPGAPTIEGRRGRPSVMVVDDLPDARKILSIYLSRTGYQVVTASSAEDCLAKLRHHEVHAVVLDASMPGGGGAQVCRTLRQDPSYLAKRDLPVIVYTAYPDDYPPSVVETWGATDYVVKGGDMLPLITALVRHTKEQLEALK
jgi:CheY-like chemotaxis protein